MTTTLAPVPLAKAYRLLNHGPTVLVSAAHAEQRSVMAAAWAMAVDFEPCKVAVVLDKQTWTRQLLEAEGSFVLNVPCAAQVDLVQTVGNTSGWNVDKFDAYDIESLDGERISAPRIAGCVAWLECRLLPEARNQQRYDLFLGEVVAAQADTRVFRDGHWDFSGQDGLRTLHHVAGGHFLVIGDGIQGRMLEPRA